MMDIIIVLFCIVGITTWLIAFKRRLALPVRFTSRDEIYAVQEAAMLGRSQTPADYAKSGRFISLQPRLTGSGIMRNSFTYNRLPLFPSLVHLSKEELEMLAPFIDQIIDGKASWGLPAEYEDYRPAVLQAFKERMIAQHLWPSQSRIS
jgi:hypothetical protein